MQIKTRCPKCQKSLRCPEEHFNSLARCPSCKHKFRVTLSTLREDDLSGDSGGRDVMQTIDRSGPPTSSSGSEELTKPKGGSPNREKQDREKQDSKKQSGESEPSVGKIAHYDLKEKLGEGGFGIVYRAWDTKLSRWVALKVPRFLMLEQKKLRRFRQEAQSAARLQHPNIVAIFEEGQEGDRPYIVSEYVDGEPLSTRIKKDRPNFQLAAKWVRELANALAYAHERGVIHRDIKPDNIMLGKQGRPQIMDFGLAKQIDADASLSIDGSVLGTPAYMSPEQARGEINLVDERSDQYCLGVVLYELMTGCKPFEGPTHSVLVKVADKHLEPPAPRKMNPQIPRDLEAICLTAISKDPKLRYDNMSALAMDLERWEQGRPTQVRSVGKGELAWRWCRRNPVLAGFVVTTTLLALWGSGATLYVFWNLWPSQQIGFTPEPQKEPTAEKAEKIEREPSKEPTDEIGEEREEPPPEEKKEEEAKGDTALSPESTPTVLPQKPSLRESISELLTDMDLGESKDLATDLRERIELLDRPGEEEDFSGEFINQLRQALTHVKQAGTGHVVIGKLPFLTNMRSNEIIGTVPVFEDGTFVESVRTAGAPLYFWHPKFGRLSALSIRSDRPIEYLGTPRWLSSRTGVFAGTGGVVHGQLICDLPKIPEDFQVEISFLGRVPNVLRSSPEEALQLETHIQSRLKEELLPNVDIQLSKESGEFRISNLPAVPFVLRFQSASFRDASIELLINSGESLDLGTILLYLSDNFQPSLPTEGPEMASIDKQDFQNLLLSLGRLNKSLESTANLQLAEVEKVRERDGVQAAVVVAGQVVPPGNSTLVPIVEAGTKIFEGGYFSTKARPGKPVRFRRHGYQPLDYVPRGGQNGLEYAGTLQMIKTPSDQMASIRGAIVIAENPPLEFPSVNNGRRLSNDHPESLSRALKASLYDSVEGDELEKYKVEDRSGRVSLPVKLQANNFEVRGLSPIRYHLLITGSGYSNQTRFIHCEPQQRVDLGTIRLYRNRQMRADYYVSTDGNFSARPLLSKVTYTDNVRWRAIEANDSLDLQSFWDYSKENDFNLESQGQAVIVRPSAGACRVLELGVGRLDDYRSIYCQGMAMPQSAETTVSLRTGHVYLIHQENWKHWILLQPEIESIP